MALGTEFCAAAFPRHAIKANTEQIHARFIIVDLLRILRAVRALGASLGRLPTLVSGLRSVHVTKVPLWDELVGLPARQDAAFFSSMLRHKATTLVAIQWISCLLPNRTVNFVNASDQPTLV